MSRSSNLSQATRNNDSQKKKRTSWIVNFAVPTDHRVKWKESGKRDKYLDLAGEQKTMEHEGNGDTSSNWCTWNNPKRIGKGAGRLGKKGTSEDHPDYSIIKIRQNTEKSPGDLRLAVTQTPVKDHLLTLL